MTRRGPFGVRSRWDLTPRGFLRCLRRKRRARRIRRQRIPFPLWHGATRRLPTLERLQRREGVALRELAGRFLQEKVFSGAGGLNLDNTMRISIAAQACLMIVNRGEGLRPFAGWREVIVYPDTFRVRRETIDDSGVMHISDDDLAGEAWDQGPVILSWGDIEPNGPGSDLFSAVVLHEFAHKLDALGGAATGMPPLPGHMDRSEWTRVFTNAYKNLCAEVDAGIDTAIDPYAAEAPAEFFAVATEYYFEEPDTLKATYPEVYALLAAYYPLGSGPNGT